MLKQLTAAFAGGLMISIGGAVYLNAIGALNTTSVKLGSVVGAFFFSVALICICLKGYGLFTGRVGYLADNPTPAELAGLSMTLLGNAIGTFLFGLLLSGGKTGALSAVAASLMAAKFEVAWYTTLLRAILCGVLMYLAVSIYREKGTVTGILFCVPAFILAGFEHSIADMFYYATGLPLLLAGGESLAAEGLWFLPLVILGNAAGGLLLPLLSRLMADRPGADGDGEEEETV